MVKHLLQPENADNVIGLGALKSLYETMFGPLGPQPPVWDLIGFAHGPYQEACERSLSFLMLQRDGASLEAELLQRLRAMLDSSRHRLVLLPSHLPGKAAPTTGAV